MTFPDEAPSALHVSLAERMRDIAARVVCSDPVAASELNDLAVNVARMERDNRTLRSTVTAPDSATILPGPWRTPAPRRPSDLPPSAA